MDGTLVKPAPTIGYCSVDGTLVSVLTVGYCSEDGTLIRVASYRSLDEALLNTTPDGGAYFSSDATRTSVPDESGGGEYGGCSVDGTRFRLATVTYCSADGTRVILEYCSTETVLVRVPPAVPPPALDAAAACCSVDGILVRVPRLLAEQLVVIIVEVQPKATDRRFGL